MGTRSALTRWVSLALCLGGCEARSTGGVGPAPTDVPGTSCTTGTVAQCICVGGARGRQLCGLDMAYGPCVCEGDGGVSAPTDVGMPGPDAGPPVAPVPGPACVSGGNVDLLVMVDNSNSMVDNQRILSTNFGAVVDTLLNPEAGGRVRSLHIGVISSDLGTSGSTVPSCANSDTGDDGRLNPIANGLALRTHLPWTTAAPGARPRRCTQATDQYPTFLSFAADGDATALREDFICNAYLSIGGCGLEQQLESAYRALVVHGGAGGPNAGFLRADSVLGVLFLSDEEDGSVRDCRYAEPGDPDGSCRPGAPSALEVFDGLSPRWASADLNLRFYLYTPGSDMDPTWPLTRYVDPARGDRGLLGLRPGRVNHLVVGAITGVPISLTRGETVDWDRLLGRNPDGSEGFVGSSPEGPVSMQQRNLDPVCGTRVVPACRREGTVSASTCDSSRQYFASPSRRIAGVVRRVNDVNGNGVLGSICETNYSDTLRRFAARIASRVCP